MFFARGMCTWISNTSIPITDASWTAVAQERIGDPRGNFVSASVLIAFAVVVVAAFVLAYTRLAATFTRSAAISSQPCSWDFPLAAPR
jgi:simple sugar transport system permease protein